MFCPRHCYRSTGGVFVVVKKKLAYAKIKSKIKLEFSKKCCKKCRHHGGIGKTGLREKITPLAGRGKEVAAHKCASKTIPSLSKIK